MLRLALTRPKVVLAGWAAVVGLLSLLGLGLEHRLHRTDIAVNGTAGAKADARAAHYFGRSSNLVVMLTGPARERERQGKRLAGRIDRRPGVAVLGPWAPEARRTLQPGRNSSLVLIRVGGDFDRISRVVVPQVRSDVRRTIHRPLHGYVSGYADVAAGIHDESVSALKRAELIAAPLLLLVLMLVFRSPVAASIPLTLGLTTISTMAGVLELVNHVKEIDVVALNMGSMMGLALGVDYSLVMVSRFREELAAGAEPVDAMRRTGLTAGRTVKFAGLALVVAMVAAAFVAPGGILMSSGIGTITATVVSVLGAATALPAILVLIGRRVDRWSFGRSHTSDSRWGGAALSVIRRPALAAAVVLALLLGLAAPALALAMGSPDPRDLPKSAAERQDFDVIYSTLAGGWTAPYEVVVAAKDGPITDPKRLSAIERWQREVARDPKVKAVMGPAPIPRRSRQAQRTGRQLSRLRSQFANGGRGLDRLSNGLGRLDRGVAQMRGGLRDAAGRASPREQGGAAA